MDLLYLVASILFFIAMLKGLFQSAHLLSKSKYSFNLFFSRIRESSLSPFGKLISTIRLFGLLLFIPASLNDVVLTIYHYIVTGILFFDFVLFAVIIKSRYKAFFQIRPRELLIVAPAAIALVLLYLNAIVDKFFWLLLLERSITLIYLFFAFTLSFPLEIYEDIIMEKAKKIRRSHKHMLAIALIGLESNRAGHYINDLLKIIKKQIVVIEGMDDIITTARNMRKLSPNIEACIMNITGSKESIIKIIEMINPQILITIDPQTDKRFNELMVSITEQKLVIRNISSHKLSKNNSQILKSRTSKFNIVPYFISKSERDWPSYIDILTIKIANIRVELEGITFQVFIKGRKYVMHARLLGREQLEAIIPTIILASYLGFTTKEIVHYISRLKPLVGNMYPHITPLGAMVIDYSAAMNSASVDSIMEYLQLYSGKKIVVLPSLFHFNNKSHTDAKKLVLKIAQVCDYCIFLDNESAIISKEYIRNKEMNCIILGMDEFMSTSFLTENLKTKNDIAIAIGKGTDQIVNKIIYRFKI